MVFTNEGNVYDTVIAENKDISSFNIPEIMYLILPSLHIGGERNKI